MDQYGTGKTTALAGTTTTSLTSTVGSGAPPPGSETPEQELARLRARVRELVEIERSSYYAWQAVAPAREARARADAVLARQIRAVRAKDKTCGAPRITAELNDGKPAGERVNHKRVARVMREHGIRGYTTRRRVRTTVPEPSGQKVPDLLGRDFTAEGRNQRYVGDITYLPLADWSNLYLATVIDCYSRRLAGWAVANHMRTELVEDALKAANTARGSLAGASRRRPRGGAPYRRVDLWWEEHSYVKQRQR